MQLDYWYVCHSKKCQYLIAIIHLMMIICEIPLGFFLGGGINLRHVWDFFY